MFNVCIGLNSELMFDKVCVYIHINRYSTFSNVSLLLNLIWATRTELTFENLSTEETMQVFLSSLFKLAHMDKPQKRPIIDTLQHTATHCNTLQFTATHFTWANHTRDSFSRKRPFVFVISHKFGQYRYDQKKMSHSSENFGTPKFALTVA